MGLIDSTIRTITCNGPKCNCTITFDRRLEKQTFDAQENVWLKSTRIIQTLDGRTLVYCSDICEVNGVGTGQHNMPEPKTIIEPGASAEAIAAAAQAARQAETATAAIKAGQPATLQVTLA